MTTITQLCQSLKQGFTPKNQDFSQPVRCWSEQDRLNDTITSAFVIIFKTKGCHWAHTTGCTMCGYYNDTAWKHVTSSQLHSQLNKAFEQYKNEKIVKIFTSGSFFDTRELPEAIQNKVLITFAKTAEKISVESRPEFLTNKNLSRFKKHSNSAICEVGIGLETAQDWIRTTCINKGFTFSAYQKAAQTMKKQGINVKTYVLLKPPFLTEQQAITDATNTIQKINPYTDLVSLNPVNVQRKTLVEYLWRRHQYRPPWLWSVIDVLKTAKKYTDHRIQCDIVGGGSQRGAHNCGSCDREILKAIREFSLHQNTKIFNTLSCTCKEQWQDQLEIEPLSFCSIIDTSRGIL